MLFAILLTFYTSSVQACLPWQLAHRTGTDSCWARYSISHHQTCVSRSLWMEWLQSNHPASLCFGTIQKWKSLSPLVNLPHSTQGKEVLFRSHLIRGMPGLKKSQASFQDRTQDRTQDPAQDRVLSRTTTFPKFQMTILRKIEKAREEVSLLLQPYDSMGILRSLILHENPSREPLPMLRSLGFVHLVTTAGIHLYVIQSWVNSFCLICFQILGLNVQLGLRISRIFSFGICGTVWILGGARIGMLRPTFVILLRSFSSSFGIRWKKASPLGCSLLLECLISAYHYWYSGVSPISGRWIYALAVGGGMYWHQSFRSKHLGLALGSWILVALWEAWEGLTVSLATPLLSLITLPFICLVLYPWVLTSILLFALGSQGLSHFLLQRVAQIIQIGMKSMTRLALLPGNLWIVSHRSLVFGFVLSTLLLFVSRKQRKFHFALTLILILLILVRLIPEKYKLERPSVKEAEQVIQLDVGQGDAAIVLSQTSDSKETGMIDTGSRMSLSDERWLKIFAQWRIDRISWIALTHLDEDHAGALLRLAKLIPIRCVATSEEELTNPRGIQLSSALYSHGIRTTTWKSPSCVPYPALGPSKRRTPARKSQSRTHSQNYSKKYSQNHSGSHSKNHSQNNSNDQMSAIWIPLNKTGFYLSAGDASAEDEIRIGQWANHLAQNRNGPRILKISHHGSRYSTSEKELKIIRPTEAWISVGQGNSYGHPSIPTLHLLNRLGIRSRRTDQEGALTFERKLQK